MRQLVVNADDLGMTRGVNRAVVEAYRAGIVKSASLIANAAAFEDAAAMLRQSPGLSVGLHVNITEGRPLRSAKSSLVDRGGIFHRPAAMAIRLSLGAISMRDLEDEITAQAERVVSAGISLRHFDSHHNVHLHPVAAKALASVAGRMNVRWIRFRGQRPMLPAINHLPLWVRLDSRARHLLAMLGFRLAINRGMGWSPPRSIIGTPQLRHHSPHDLFAALLSSCGEGITEWVCHPGYADAELCAMVSARAARLRQRELQLLTDPDSRTRLEAAGIGLVSYAELGG
jgi:predicted glycoside hydrolase/deacetylase ChbG (UPF0249 family)